MEGAKIKEEVTVAGLNPERKMIGLYEERSPSGRSGLERGRPGITVSPAPQDSEEKKGAKAGASRSSQQEPLKALAPATVYLCLPACCLRSLHKS